MYEPQRFDYGEHPSQYAELWVPDSRAHAAIAIIIHGGFWRQAYGAEYGRPLARDLRDRGYVVWNLEYRRTNGGDGGWPETFLDVAAGLDGLESALESSGLEPGPRVGIGHSAGGHLALWAAGRHLLPPAAPGALPETLRCLDAVISQAGVLDLALAESLALSDHAARLLMRCAPAEDPERWKWADPADRIPLGIPLLMLHGTTDEDVPVELGRSFARRAMAAGGPVDYLEFEGDHYGLITPGDRAWEMCVEGLGMLAAGRSGGE
ncbi:alpha/beta hydrolase family protein [Paeniglutamicibacter sp. NPDC012692]|uniref:alpha/beta hydrolase family protein n=1 Tax=Paeniglutamicibacter sp. NPDC012692 TaxID=3364388 RepID=UPI0036A44210